MSQTDWPAVRADIERGLDALTVRLEASQVSQLVRYLQLLQQWNRVWNLTRITDPADMVRKHLLDALLLLPHLEHAMSVLDVGSGAGIPGIPLAIASPDRQFLLIDAVGKKCRFLEHCRIALGLGNLSVVHGRVESLKMAGHPDLILSRAFANLEQFHTMTRSLAGLDTRWLAMKARLQLSELEPVSHLLEVKVHQVDLPGSRTERCLVEMKTRTR